MCDVCSEIILRDNFYSPQDYLDCLNYISELVSENNFEITYQTCDVKIVARFLLQAVIPTTGAADLLKNKFLFFKIEGVNYVWNIEKKN